MHIPRHILITGASSGLGAALAHVYAEPGTHLSLHGRNGERLNQVLRDVERLGATATSTLCDVNDKAAMADWTQSCDRRQPIDLILANAGISAGTGGGRESEEQSRAIFATNFTGILNTIHPLLPNMTARQKGQIALTSSLAGFRGFAGAPAYCASKAAIRIYGEALRGDLMTKGVAVNVICPGFIKTPMTDVNRFPMPFKMSAEAAARIIRSGLSSNRARIAFPFIMYALVRVLAALPQSWTERSMARLPRKGA